MSNIQTRTTGIKAVKIQIMPDKAAESPHSRKMIPIPTRIKRTKKPITRCMLVCFAYLRRSFILHRTILLTANEFYLFSEPEFGHYENLSDELIETLDERKSKQMKAPSWLARFNCEIENAQAALRNGKAGRARVCARRAAGIVAKEYLHRTNKASHKDSAYENIRALQSMQEIPPEIQAIINHFIIRVNSEHQLPVDADLIQEAIWLKNKLLDQHD